MNEPCIHLKIKGKKNQNLKRLEKDSQGQKLKLKKKTKHIVEYINKEENTQGSSKVGSLMDYKSSC